MTEDRDSAVSEDQRDRIARLEARRTTLPRTRDVSQPPRRRRRRHPAAKSRVAAAGLGAATMFGIVTVLGLDHPFAGAEQSPPPTSTPPATAPAVPPIQVVIHRIPVPVSPTSVGPTPAPSSDPEPIVLTATPVVQTVTVAAPPRASAPGRPSSPAPQASSPAPAPAPPAATTSGSN